ncbi:unnamed protein product [Mytilus edulis]|uniref:DZIP3-like HEPN domain-containing protein n=1 Tax=Mytilus edulis TaxID=6550 RepID=A0A8S3QNJ4_MYTED|nr:unnamed protein product [Mytilus edulis]
MLSGSRPSPNLGEWKNLSAVYCSNTVTINMSAESNERLARLGSIAKELFPKVMQHILKECISPRGLQVKYQLNNIPTKFTESEISLMEKLPNLDNFTTELCFKILRFENLLHEPSCKWENIPHDTEVEIGDDIQRILNATNDVISRKSDVISELYYEEFLNRTQQVLQRVDAYLCQDTCLQLYQTIHSSDINISDMLQQLTLMQEVTEEFGEPKINLPEKVTGTCLMGNKGHVVVNFEVKNKIFHSTDSLHRTLKGVFNTLLMKGNGKNFLGKTDVYAELVKSEIEEANAQTQTSEGKLDRRQK